MQRTKPTCGVADASVTLRWPGSSGPLLLLLEPLLSCSWCSQGLEEEVEEEEEGRSFITGWSTPNVGNWSSSVVAAVVDLTGAGSNTVLLLFLASRSTD